MSKLTVTNILSGYQTTTAENANNAAIVAAIENTLSRDGTTPNAMGAELDMNSHKIINVAAPTTGNDAARLVDVQAAIAGTSTANLVSFTPYGNIASTSVQGALQEEVDDLVSSGGSSLVGFLPVGTGAVATTVESQLKNKLSKNISDFLTAAQIADITNRTELLDLTVPIQTAISYAVTNGIVLDFIPGAYAITDELILPAGSGYWIRGAGRACCSIKQKTSNKRIFHFQVATTHSFIISGFWLDYATQQTSAEQYSIPISFMGTVGIPANGFYNFQIFDIIFNNCFRQIQSNPLNQTAVWGYHIHDCWTSTTCTGGFAYLVPTPTIGQPNGRMTNIYIAGNAIESTETIFSLGASNCAKLDNVEINTLTNGPKILSIAGGGSCSIGVIRIEGATFTTASSILFDYSTSYLSIDILQMNTVTFNAGGGTKSYILGCSGGIGARALVGRFTSSITVTSGTLFIAHPNVKGTLSFNSLASVPAGAYLTDIAGSGSANGVDVVEWNNGGNNGDSGDLDTTVVVGTTRNIIRYATTLTANRVVTLPAPTPGNMFEGLKYKVIKTGAGNFKLTINMAAATYVASFPPNSVGSIEFTYVRSTWLVSDSNITESVSADRGDNSITVLVGDDSITQVFDSPISANRTVTLSTTHAKSGDRFRFVRTANATGAFNLTIGSTIKVMATSGSFSDVVFNGTAWILSGYGVL